MMFTVVAMGKENEIPEELALKPKRVGGRRSLEACPGGSLYFHAGEDHRLESGWGCRRLARFRMT